MLKNYLEAQQSGFEVERKSEISGRNINQIETQA